MEIVDKDFSDLARKRYSCRTFRSVPLSKEDFLLLNRYCDQLSSDFGKAGLRFRIVSSGELHSRRMFLTGTYGMIRNPAAYLVGVIRNGDWEDWLLFGSAMETAVLTATAHEIGSCWIGGVFDRRTFSRLVHLDPRERVPAVIALGYPAARASLRDKLVRWSARGASRASFGKLFFHHQWQHPLAPDTYPRVTPLLENIRIAPSASNRQPWRIVMDDRHLTLYLVRSPGYRRLTPAVDLQAVDMGIALRHLEGSAREFGIRLTRTDLPVHKGELNAKPVARFTWS